MLDERAAMSSPPAFDLATMAATDAFGWAIVSDGVIRQTGGPFLRLQRNGGDRHGWIGDAPFGGAGAAPLQYRTRVPWLSAKHGASPRRRDERSGRRGSHAARRSSTSRWRR
jgi:hypothetical protein